MSGCWSFFLRVGAIIGSFVLTAWVVFSILGWIHSANAHFTPFDWQPGDTPNTWIGHLGIGFLVSFLILIACTVICGFFIKFALGIVQRPLGAIGQVAETTRWKNPKLIFALTFSGSILAGMGFLVPWVTVSFAPPGGSLILGGIRRYAFSTTLSGFNMPYSPIPVVDSIRSQHILWITILTLFFLSLSLLVDLFPRSLHQAKTGISHLLDMLATFLSAPIPRGVINLIQTLGHILASLAWLVVVGFVLIYGNPVAQTNSGNYVSIPYVTITMGVGIGLMMVGFALSGIGIYQNITIQLEGFVIEELTNAAGHLGQGLGQAGQGLATVAGTLGQSLGITRRIARFLEKLSLLIIRVSLVILLLLGSLAFAYIVLLPLLLKSLGFHFD